MKADFPLYPSTGHLLPSILPTVRDSVDNQCIADSTRHRSVQLTRFGPVAVRLLTPCDMDAILGLRARIFVDVPTSIRNHFVERDEAAFVHGHLGEAGDAIGIFLSDRLIACAMVGYPTAHASGNPGWLLGMPEYERAGVAVFDGAMVLPGFRRLGLHHAMTRDRLALALNAGRHHCMAMVPPDGHFSRHSLHELGFGVTWAGRIDGLRWHLLGRHCDAPVATLERGHQFAMGHDFERHAFLTQSGMHSIVEHGAGPRSCLEFAPRHVRVPR